MASNGDLGPDKARDALEQVGIYGYFLGPDQRLEDILAVEAELLRSEGIDPTWPGFESDPERASA